MTIEDFIRSGNLELYVLGLSSEEEKKEIEFLLLTCSKVRLEVENIEVALEKLAADYTTKPCNHSEEKVIMRIFKK